MTLQLDTFGALSPVQVITTSGRGLGPDEITSMALNKILSVSDNTPPAIREQAIAFRDKLANVLRYYIGVAQRSERTTLIGQLRQAGHHAAADMMETL